jgi:dihydrolipoamide dehydrogenase
LPGRRSRSSRAIPAVVHGSKSPAGGSGQGGKPADQGRPLSLGRIRRALTLDHQDEVTKLILIRKAGGFCMGIVGAGAGELIAEGVLAVEMGALASDIMLSIHPHPTLSETIMEAAEVYFGQSTHIYRPKKD